MYGRCWASDCDGYMELLRDEPLVYYVGSGAGDDRVM